MLQYSGLRAFERKVCVEAFPDLTTMSDSDLKGEGELAHVDVERLTEILSGKAAPGGAPPAA